METSSIVDEGISCCPIEREAKRNIDSSLQSYSIELSRHHVQSIRIRVFFSASASRTSRDLATTPSCIFLSSVIVSRFPRMTMMMMMVPVVVVFPVTAALATFSFFFSVCVCVSLFFSHSFFFARNEHAISLFQSTTHFCRHSTITTTITHRYCFFPLRRHVRNSIFFLRFFSSFLRAQRTSLDEGASASFSLLNICLMFSRQ